MNLRRFAWFLSSLACSAALTTASGCDDDSGTTSDTFAETDSDSDSGLDPEPGPCEQQPPLVCLEACGSDIEVDSTCVDEVWTCEGGVDASTCPDACAGDPPPCLEGCGSDIALAEAQCLDGAFWCEQGVLPDAPECGEGLCADPAPMCVATCESDAPYDAECIDTGWDCGQGLPVDSCPE